jgi:ribosomal protein S18 acetylase RimI-like enzyme
MVSDLIIRSWQAGDLEEIRRITWATWVATYASFVPEADLRAYFDKAYTIGELATLLVSPDFRGLIVEEHGAPIGYAKVVYAPAEEKCYLASLYVLPGHQGKGIGSLLLEHAERHAVAFGMHEIWLGVMVQNTRTMQWYERIGFVFVKEEPFTMGTTNVPHRIGYRRIELSTDEHRTIS